MYASTLVCVRNYLCVHQYIQMFIVLYQLCHQFYKFYLIIYMNSISHHHVIPPLPLGKTLTPGTLDLRQVCQLRGFCTWTQSMKRLLKATDPVHRGIFVVWNVGGRPPATCWMAFQMVRFSDSFPWIPNLMFFTFWIGSTSQDVYVQKKTSAIFSR